MEKINQIIGGVKHALNMVRAKKWILVNTFDGLPKPSDFLLVEEELEQLQDREILLEALYLSVDPYMRLFCDPNMVGQTMTGSQIARVVKSRNPDFPVNTIVRAQVGWRTQTNVNPDDEKPKHFGQPLVVKIGDLNGEATSVHLGALGLPGATAYLAMTDILKPQPGETLVVNSAAGAVGSVVGQLAKEKGLTVIGYAGSDEKCKVLKDLGFHAAFNYKTTDLANSLKEAAPNGVDCYFDHVGGEFASTVINHMNLGGRVAVVGCIGSYNNQQGTVDTGTLPYMKILSGALTIQGFHATAHYDRWIEAFQYLKPMISEGKLSTPEHITNGFEFMPYAFIGQLKGENIGKSVVKP